MCPKPRNGLNARLPPNLSLHATGQYRYIHPIKKNDHYLGINRQRAIEAAQKLNAILMPTNSLVDRVVCVDHKLSECVEYFRREEIPRRKWRETTAERNEYFLKRIERDLGSSIVEDLTVKDCAAYLRGMTDSWHSRLLCRAMLILILDCAVQEGWVDHNVAKATKAVKPARLRARLTFDAYQKIFAHAEPWLQNAMDLSLHTLLRRADVATMRFTDMKDGFLFVIPHKTESTTYVRMKMKIEGDLQKVVQRCQDDMASPYLVHRMPDKLRPHGKRGRGRDHHLQVLPGYISRAFTLALRAAGLAYGEQPCPTFHEIRSLGGDLYRQAGWTLQQVQTLMGHSSEDMTRRYLEGHEAPWVEVRAGLNIAC